MALGFGLGVLCAWAQGRYVESVLYGVRPLDPVVTALVSLVLMVAARAAIGLPAWRAARLDPIVAPRQE